MPDKISQYILSMGGDSSDLDRVFSAIKTSAQSNVRDLERITNSADLYSQLQDNLPKIQAAIDRNTASAKAFQDTIDRLAKAGEPPIQALSDGLKKFQDAATAATKELDKQNAALAKLTPQLQAAGVDTNNLTVAQQKLAVSLAEATAAQELQAAKSLLGLKTLSDTVPQINALNAAFQLLKTSGASIDEVVQGERLLEQKTADILAGVTQLPGALEKAGTAGVSAFNAMGGGALLALVGVGSLAAGIKNAIDASIEFTTNIGRIGTITTLTGPELDKLGESARTLARTLGIDVNDALKALYELVRSASLGPEDAITVLTASAEAAKASFTDLNVVTRISAQLISAYKLPVSEVSTALNELFTSAQHGGPALGELGDNFGKLLLAAKDSNVPLNVVIAALDSMSSATGDAGSSVNDLQKLLLKFDTAKVQQSLRDAGITAHDFQGVMDELAAKGLHIEDFVQLGLVSAKTGVALDALTQGSKPLSVALGEVASNANATADALAKVEKTPKDNIDKLVAAFKDLATSAGNSAPVTLFANALQAAGDRAAEATKANRELEAELKAIEATLDQTIPAFERRDQAIKIYSDRVAEATDETEQFRQEVQKGTADKLAADAQAAADAMQKLSADTKKAIADIVAARDVLAADAGKLQAAADLEIAASKKSTDEQIAGLSRLKDSTADTYAALLQIQTDGAEQRLAIIEKTEAAVNKLLDDAIGKREKQLADEVTSGKTTYAQGQAELAQIRLDAINKTLKDYQGEYDTLAKQQGQYDKDSNAAALAKLEFDKGIEKTLFDFRIQSLGNFQANINTANAAQSENLDQYVAQVKEANRLIAAAQAEATAGNAKAAEVLAKQAIDVAGQLKTVVSANGSVIVSSFDLVQQKSGLVKQAVELVDQAFDDQGSAAEKGAKESGLWLGITEGRILDLQLKVDELASTVAKGLTYSISVDEKTYQDALDKLAALHDKTVTVTIQTVDQQGDPIGFVGPPVPGVAAGGYVGKAIQGFATGGSVFRLPTWSKVPGFGDGDTVPAMLQSGSFVIRKAISQSMGDDAMGRLARAYASGGWVPPGGPASPWAGGQSAPLSNADQVAQSKAMHDLRVQADVEVFAMLSRAVGLPPARWGQDVRDYIGKVHEAMLAAQNVDELTALLDKLVTYYARFYPAIESSKEWHVPLVMGVDLVADPTPSKPAPAPYYPGQGERQAPGTLLDGKLAGSASDAPVPIFAPGNPFGFATGGEVPAWVTPGEWVLKPEAVQNIARMWGGGFLPALNAGLIPRGAFENLSFAPPAPRFAQGGPVLGPGTMTISSPASAPSGNGSPRPIEFHFHGVDISNPSEVRRVLLPVLRDIDRRTQ